MCLPFCCGEDDQGTQHDGKGHGDGGQMEPPVVPLEKEANNGNGAPAEVDPRVTANLPKSEEHFKKGSPTRPPQSPEVWAQKREEKKMPREDRETKIPSTTTPAVPVEAPKPGSQKIVEASVAAAAPESKDRISTASPPPATKAPKQLQHVVASPSRRAGPVAARQPKEATDSARTPPEPQIAHRGREEDYDYPIASPTLPAPAANNSHGGGRGHGEFGGDQAYGGKDDRKPPGRSRTRR